MSRISAGVIRTRRNAWLLSIEGGVSDLIHEVCKKRLWDYGDEALEVKSIPVQIAQWGDNFPRGDWPKRSGCECSGLRSVMRLCSLNA